VRRHCCADLARALHVYLQEHRLPRVQPPSDRRSLGSVPVAVVLCPFQQLAIGNHLPELIVAGEEILSPVHLAGSRPPCGDRYRLPDPRAALLQVCRNRALADGGRAGQNRERRRDMGAAARTALNVRAGC
jgi:hypothetical protein